jgi:hypothetical protein
MLCVCCMYMLTYAIRMQVRCERRRLEHLKALERQCEADRWPYSSTAKTFKADVQARLVALLKSFGDDTLGAQFTRLTVTKLERENTDATGAGRVRERGALQGSKAAYVC